MRQQLFGITNDLHIEVDREAVVVILTGVPQDSGERSLNVALTFRATYLLWYRLTQALYPNDAPTMTAAAGTAPLYCPEGYLMTGHVDLMRLEAGGYEMIGISPETEWHIRISDAEARRLWAALDVALYPMGWQGRESEAGDDAAYR